MTKVDPTGFAELIRTLAVAGRAFDERSARQSPAGQRPVWVRTGNEDAFHRAARRR